MPVRTVRPRGEANGLPEKGEAETAAAAPSWEDTFRRCVQALAAVPGVQALATVGSSAGEGTLDRWSDLDLVVVVADSGWEGLFPGLGWLRTIGEVYAFETAAAPAASTVRVCFANLARVDFILVAASRLRAFAAVPGPLQGGARVALDRSGGALAAALRLVPAVGADAGGAAQDAFAELERGFRWNGVLAAVKVGRGDLLIGGHLALEMARACLVLAMLLRDRALGTRHHRHGDGTTPPLALPPTLSATGVADLVVACVDCWSRLGAEWDPAYVFPRGPLLALLGRSG